MTKVQPKLNQSIIKFITLFINKVITLVQPKFNQSYNQINYQNYNQIYNNIYNQFNYQSYNQIYNQSYNHSSTKVQPNL